MILFLILKQHRPSKLIHTFLDYVLPLHTLGYSDVIDLYPSFLFMVSDEIVRVTLGLNDHRGEVEIIKASYMNELLRESLMG
jgi:hypothetical protein